MSFPARRVAVLGSTGSIGENTLEVIAASRGCLEVAALSAHTRLDRLAEQARRFRPRAIVAADAERASRHDYGEFPAETAVFCGPAGLESVACAADVDIVVAAIVGCAGLLGTWSAIEAGKTVALANKEMLVVAGPLATSRAKETGAVILPVDSEHSAVFQCLAAGRRSEVRRIILTASGGPFREKGRQELENVTVEQALAHPTWNMGPKITVDSATMMNKALEIIEARWLFDLPADRIDVVIHPQSIVHSMVEYTDGAVVAQLSPPDMKLPIQYALSWPDRWEGPAERLDWSRTFNLEFEPPDEERFPALTLGHEVAAAGGTAGAVVNAANEAAVAAFLAGRLKFTRIVPACRAVLQTHTFDHRPTLTQLLSLDAWARRETERWIGS